jgi:hypothetical protein
VHEDEGRDLRVGEEQDWGLCAWGGARSAWFKDAAGARDELAEAARGTVPDPRLQRGARRPVCCENSAFLVFKIACVSSRVTRIKKLYLLKIRWDKEAGEGAVT